MTENSSLDRIRKLGRRMMDLTGNGPPSRGERIRQTLMLAKPHPRYTAIGSIFVSTCASGDVLSAIVVRKADAQGYEREVVQLITATGSDPLADGTDGDLIAEFEASLFRLEPGTGWHNHTADEIARMIAKIGRHLHFHAATDSAAGISEDGALILADDSSQNGNALGLMQGLMAYNGICGEAQEMHFFAATPNQPSELRLVNIDGHLSDALEVAFKIYLQTQLKVRVAGDKLFVCTNGYAVNISTATPAEQAEFTAHVMAIFEKHGVSHEHLRISSDLQDAA